VHPQPEPHAKGLCDMDLLEWQGKTETQRRQGEGGRKSARVPGPKNGFRIGFIPQRGKKEAALKSSGHTRKRVNAKIERQP
jgi:hypothetical protein